MVKDRLIVCVASSWDYDPTSKHHLMKRLARHNRVLWVNYHGTRRPAMNSHDFRGALNVLKRIGRGVQPISPTMWQMTPFVIPAARNAALRGVHEWLVTRQIVRAARLIQQRENQPIQVWSFAPDVPFLAGKLGEECFVYYCVDDYTRFECHDPALMIAQETRLLQTADVVVATSEPLLKEKRKIRSDALLIRHGVDFEHFARAWRDPPPIPDDLARIPSPRFGFFGLIQHWIDRELLAEVARLRSNYSFVLIGEAKSDVSMFDGIGNVRLLGRRAYEHLPAYCAQFAAGLLPFARNEMTACINPIKLPEYLAAGLPVVSTDLPEARRFAGAVRFGSTPHEFAEACDLALKDRATTRPIDISHRVEHESWESRLDELAAIMDRRINGVRAQDVLMRPTCESQAIPAMTADV